MWHQTVRSELCTGGSCSYPKGPRQAGERDQNKPHKGKNVESCTWGGATPGNRTCWGLSSWKGAGQKKALGILVDAELNLHQQCVLATKEANGLRAAVDKVLPAGQGRGFFPSPQNWCGHTCNAASSTARPSTRGMWIDRGNVRKRPQQLLRNWASLLWQKAERAGEAQRKEDGGEISSIPEGGCKEVRDRLFSVVWGGRTRHNRYMLKQESFSLNTRKCFVYCEGDWAWAQATQRSSKNSRLGDGGHNQNKLTIGYFEG